MDVDPVAEDSIKKEESEDVEMKEDEKETKDDEEPVTSDKSDNNESDDLKIDIDPKTFCKLGHFHLLLGDFAKGTHTHYLYRKFLFNLRIYLKNFSLIRISKI